MASTAPIGHPGPCLLPVACGQASPQSLCVPADPAPAPTHDSRANCKTGTHRNNPYISATIRTGQLRAPVPRRARTTTSSMRMTVCHSVPVPMESKTCQDLYVWTHLFPEWFPTAHLTTQSFSEQHGNTQRPHAIAESEILYTHIAQMSREDSATACQTPVMLGLPPWANWCSDQTQVPNTQGVCGHISLYRSATGSRAGG